MAEKFKILYFVTYAFVYYGNYRTFLDVFRIEILHYFSSLKYQIVPENSFFIPVVFVFAIFQLIVGDLSNYKLFVFGYKYFAIMVFPLDNGLLPTPNSPPITSANMDYFISPSKFPLPYQAVSIIESFPLICSPTWDLNVSSKNVKLKLEWSISGNGKVGGSSDIFPKPVLKSLATYGLNQPTGSSSCNGAVFHVGSNGSYKSIQIVVSLRRQHRILPLSPIHLHFVMILATDPSAVILVLMLTIIQ